MDETTDPRRRAADKRRAREQRMRDLRARVVAVAVALFVAAWAGLFIQLVSGHDPALAGEVAPVAQAADPEAATDDSADDGWSDGASADDGWSSSDTASTDSSQPAAVTTRQS
jgi:predicted metal-binding membrane protein